ncbi:hypothetical protein ACIHEI_34265 [Kitasatospora sp. NPDC051984]|uniref:hypothetical protein n=1 Tax=Kitasatospora sp. NPDC051984 TaxID=3364059 RepID=UPI0037CA61B9
MNQRESSGAPPNRRALLTAAAGTLAAAAVAPPAAAVVTPPAGADGAPPAGADGAPPAGADGAPPAGADGAASGRDPETFGPAAVRPGDPRYESLLRGDNHRFCGRPGGTSRPHARP